MLEIQSQAFASAHFNDYTRKNLLKLTQIIFKKQSRQTKSALLQKYMKKFNKAILRPDLQAKQIEYGCLFLRLIGECLISLTSEGLSHFKLKDSKLQYQETKSLLEENKVALITLLCKASESNNSMVLNQVQHTF